MNVLLVGLGRWGEKHLRVLGELGVELWVADVSAERRECGGKAGVAARTRSRTSGALPHVDAVDVVTPADSHLALAEACLRAGPGLLHREAAHRVGGRGPAVAASSRRRAASCRSATSSASTR